MKGYGPHSASHSRAAPPHPSSAAAAAALFNQVYTNGGAAGVNTFIAYDDVFGGPPKYSVTPFPPRAEHYSEIFDSFLSGRACSIPMLDLPTFDDSSAAFDFVGCSGFVYSEIFGGFDITDFALSYDQLFRRSAGSQEPSESDAWTQNATEYRTEESDPSACSGRNQYVLNGDFHQITDNKCNVSCHKVNMASTEHSNVIHVAQLSAIPGNGDISEGSSLQKEVEERYSSGVADDIIFCEVSSEILVETQSKTTSIISDGGVKKNGRSHGINLNRPLMSVSDAGLTTEPSYAPQTSRSPPTAIDRKKDPVSPMSDYHRPKSKACKASKALFDVSSLDFLNVEFDTGSSGMASAEAIKEAMDTTKIKLKNVRESMERKKDAAKGTSPVEKNDMNGTERVRMFFDVSISRDGELQTKHESEYNLFKISRKGMQDVSEASQAANPPDRKITKNQSSFEVAEREDNGSRVKDANQVEDKEEACTQKITGGKRVVFPRDEKQQSDMWLKKADKEFRKRENEVFEKKESETKPKGVQKMDQYQKHVKEATMSNCYEKKLIQSVEKEKFEELEVATTYNRTENKVDAALDFALKSLKSERIANTDKIHDEVAEEEIENPVHTSKSENSQKMYEDSAINVEQKMYRGDLHPKLKSIEQHSYFQTHVTEKNYKVPEMICKLEEIEREHLRELELEREKERERELQKERIRKLKEEREQERNKKLKLHLQRLEELRKREREKELDKDCLIDLEEERQGERGKKLDKECLGQLDEEREREKDRMASAAHERASTEAHEMVERAAVERATAEARQRAMADARERLEKACAEAREKSLSEKASTEAKSRAEHFVVARAAAEARGGAIQKAMAERDTFEARDQVVRYASEKFSSPLRDLGLRQTSSSSDLWNSDKADEAEGESSQRCRAKLERHRRTVERLAKALAEKSTRDLIAQKEQAERNRLAEPLDADIKRWSNGKEGNLRALLSTLQYILGPDSGWNPIPLTEIIASAAVKKAYRKATLCVHPDKLQQRGATIQQKYICEKVFDLLKDSWNKFNSEER